MFSKYDPHCEHVLEETHAEAVILVVLGGDHGDGVAVNLVAPELLRRAADELPELLRAAADELERERRRAAS
jgi:hypothetical protein